MAKKNLKCLVCATALDKTEAMFVDEDTFAFLDKLPAGVSLGVYCFPCFDNKVKSELDRYNENMERAKNVNVFFVAQSKESRFVRRKEKPIQVKDCKDRDETVLRLAFIAVTLGKNALVDVDLKSVKVYEGTWQSSLWSGKAIPCDIDEAYLKRRFPIE